MAKKKVVTNGKATRLGPARKRNPRGKREDSLSKAAQDWIRLLSDPCSSALVPPCYGGTGAGYLTRVRTYVPIPATAVDYLLEFSPSSAAQYAIRYGWSATTGGSLGNAATLSVGGIVANASITGRARCAAACVKVLYTGTELERKGLVASTLDCGRTLTDNEPIFGNIGSWILACPRTVRIGAESHETLWVPGPGDDNFRVPGVVSEEEGTSENAGNSIQVALQNVTAGSCGIEITSVWEWQPAEEPDATAGPGAVSILRGPSAREPMSQILHALGDLGQFVFSRAVPVVGQLAMTATQRMMPSLRQLTQY
jgi:hypothetical protein